MTWVAILPADDDDLEISRTGAITTNGRAIIHWTGSGVKSCQDVAEQLAISDTIQMQLRIKNGRPVETYETGSGWIDTNPKLWPGTGSRSQMRARDISISRVEGAGQVFEVKYRCTGYGPLVNGSNYPISDPGVQVTTSARTRSVSMFRKQDPDSTDAFVPADTVTTEEGSTTDIFSQSVWKTGTDIGGLKCDINCQGLPATIDQTVVEISYVQHYTSYTWTSGTARDADDGTYTDLYSLSGVVGARNSRMFLKYPIGSLKWEATSLQPLEEYDYRRLTITLIYDEWHHAYQAPLTTYFAKPITADGTTGETQSAVVLWHQPYFDTWYDDASDSPQFPAYVRNYLEDLYNS